MSYKFEYPLFTDISALIRSVDQIKRFSKPWENCTAISVSIFSISMIACIKYSLKKKKKKFFILPRKVFFLFFYESCLSFFFLNSKQNSRIYNIANNRTINLSINYWMMLYAQLFVIWREKEKEKERERKREKISRKI